MYMFFHTVVLASCLVPVIYGLVNLGPTGTATHFPTYKTDSCLAHEALSPPTYFTTCIPGQITCSHSGDWANASYGYWRVEFPEDVYITTVEIYYRNNEAGYAFRMDGYTLSITKNLTSPPDVAPSDVCFRDPTDGTANVHPTLTCNMIGKYLMFSKLRSHNQARELIIELCYVKILGCPFGYFGASCNQMCPETCIGLCEPKSGHCLSGCTEGWYGVQCELSIIPFHNQPCNTSFVCRPTLKCENGLCVCESAGDQYADPTERLCKEKGIYSGPCYTSIGDITCLSTFKCENDICICESPDSQYYHPTDGMCKEKGYHNEACYASIGNITCHSTLKCENDICICESPDSQYYHPTDRMCKEKGNHNEPCYTSIGDITCDDIFICENDKCVCMLPDDQYYRPIEMICVFKGYHGETCYSSIGDVTCLSTLKCENDICICESPDSQYYHPTDRMCKEKGNHNEACYTSIGNITCHSFLKCSNDICICESPDSQYYHPTDRMCKEKGNHSDTCYTSIGNVTCHSSLKCENDICICESPDSQYYHPTDRICKEKGYHGETCYSSIGNVTCHSSLKCENDICICESPDSQYYHPTDRICKEKGYHNEACYTSIGNITCHSFLKCSNDICICASPDSEYYHPTDRMCNEKGNHSETCYTNIGNVTCHSSLKCENDVCICESPDSQYYHPTDRICKEKGYHNEACYASIGNITCHSPLKCENDICICEYPDSKYYHTTDRMCKEKGYHSETCFTSIGNVTCHSTLKCENDICICESQDNQYVHPTDRICKEKGYHNEVCYTSIGNITCHSSLKCENDICICGSPDSQYYNPTDRMCKEKGYHSQMCYTSIGNVTCYSTLKCENDICICESPDSQYLHPTDRMCKEKGYHNEMCYTSIGNMTCHSSLKCENDICICESPDSQYYHPTDRMCKEKKYIGEICDSSILLNSCHFSLKCENSVCVCENIENQYIYSVEKLCKEKGYHDEACYTSIGNITCHSSLKCENDICICESPDSQYYHPTDRVCKEIAEYGENCSSIVGDSSCRGEFKCPNNRCICPVPLQLYDSKNKVCFMPQIDESLEDEQILEILENGNDLISTDDTASDEQKTQVIEQMTNILTQVDLNNTDNIERVLNGVKDMSSYTTSLSDSAQENLYDTFDTLVDTLDDTSFVDIPQDSTNGTNVTESDGPKVVNVNTKTMLVLESMASLMDAFMPPEPEYESESELPSDTGDTEKNTTDISTDVTESPALTTTPFNILNPVKTSPETPEQLLVKKKKSTRIINIINKIEEKALSGLVDKPIRIEATTKNFKIAFGVANVTYDGNTTSTFSVSKQEMDKMIKTSFQVPPEVNDVLNSSHFKFKQLFSRNLFTWDASSRFITTKTTGLALKDVNNNPIKVKNLKTPIEIEIPAHGKSQYTTYKLNCSSPNPFLRLKMQQMENMYLKMHIVTDAPEYNVTLKLAYSPDKLILPEDCLEGYNFTEAQSELFFEQRANRITWSIGFVPMLQNSSINTTLMDFDSNVTMITVNVSTNAMGCNYWDEAFGRWATDGCNMSRDSTTTALKCNCNHLTEFAGGFFVLPNFVDPFADALLFLTFFDNPVVTCCVILIWMMYGVFLCWARRADNNDHSLTAIIVPAPSSTQESYKYLTCFKTAWKYNAGTTSNVFCYIEGNHGNTLKHCLSSVSTPGLFQAGGVDWFLITSPVDLGEIKHVHVWHDNSGFFPSWLLSRVVVKDLQTKTVKHFVHDNWLAVFKGQINVALSPLTETETMRNTKKENFTTRFIKDIRESHIVFNIISKNTYSEFTRAQRIACTVCFLLCTMLFCLMFHGIPTDDDEVSTDVTGIEFSISLKDIIIGIECSMLMLPINYVILQLFVRTERKSKRKDSYLKNTVNAILDEAESMKSVQKFPWWMIYIAWTVVTLISLIVSYFLILYGLKYGYHKSLEWLVSFLAAFLDELVLLQPLNVIFVAFVMTYILRRPAENVNMPEKIIERKEESSRYVSKPLSRRVITKAKQEYDLKLKMKTRVQDFCLYLFFTAALSFIVFSHAPIENSYRQTETVQNLIINNKYKQVNSTKDVWRYVDSSLMATLEKMENSPNNVKTPENDFILLGTVRLRQIRIVNDSCEFPEKLQNIFTIKLDCSSSLDLLNDDTSDYDMSWDKPIHSPSTVNEWTFQSAWDLMSVPFIGKLGFYGGGGYMVDFKPNSYMKILELQNKDWLDHRSKAVFIEFTLYNSNVNLFTSVMTVVEFSLSGAVLRSNQVFTSPLSTYSLDRDVTRVVMEISFCLLVLIFFLIEVKKMRQIGLKTYFTSFWSVMSTLQLILCIIMMAFYVQKYILIHNLLSEYRDNGQDRFLNFGFAVMFDNICIYVMAILMTITIAKFIEVLKLNNQLKYMYYMLMHAKGPLIASIVMFVVFLIGFVFLGHFIFGRVLGDYSSFFDSFMTLLAITVRIFHYEKYVNIAPVLGPIFLFMYFFVIIFVLMNLFTAIVLNASKFVKKAGVQKTSDVRALIKYMVNALKNALK